MLSLWEAIVPLAQYFGGWAVVCLVVGAVSKWSEAWGGDA